VFTVALAPHARAREQMLSTALIVMPMLRCGARAAGNHPAHVPDLSPNRARLSAAVVIGLALAATHAWVSAADEKRSTQP
jgi:hypothetical protein